MKKPNETIDRLEPKATLSDIEPIDTYLKEQQRAGILIGGLAWAANGLKLPMPRKDADVVLISHFHPFEKVPSEGRVDFFTRSVINTTRGQLAYFANAAGTPLYWDFPDIEELGIEPGLHVPDIDLLEEIRGHSTPEKGHYQAEINEDQIALARATRRQIQDQLPRLSSSLNDVVVQPHTPEQLARILQDETVRRRQHLPIGLDTGFAGFPLRGRIVGFS